MEEENVTDSPSEETGQGENSITSAHTQTDPPDVDCTQKPMTEASDSSFRVDKITDDPGGAPKKKKSKAKPKKKAKKYKTASCWTADKNRGDSAYRMAGVHLCFGH